jgi:hypothetical protein
MCESLTAWYPLSVRSVNSNRGAGMDNVRCRACGLLAVRDEHGSGAHEAIKYTRAEATVRRLDGKIISAEFFCRASSPAFPRLPYSGSDRTSFPKPEERQAMAALSQDRTCDSFRVWSPGKTPEEHENMGIVEQVRAESLAFREETERTAERRHQEQLDWNKQVEKNVESRHGRAIGFTFLNTLFVAALGAGGVVAIQWVVRRVFG